MNNNEIKIPDGMMIDLEKSHIVFKPFQPPKPTWADFGRIEGYFIDDDSVIWPKDSRDCAYTENRNTWPSKEEAEAALALSQLCQWRNRYNEGWIPDWSDSNSSKYVIVFVNNNISMSEYYNTHVLLTFKTRNIAEKFLHDFRELIEIAKPLL